MNKADIPFLTATKLSHLLESKELSPVETTEAFLERIDRVDSKLNSYITLSREEALRDAATAERAITRGEYLGPMHGIPVAVKDQIWTKGIRTTLGSTIMADFVPDEDATVIAKLKEAGAILLGKLNMSEFAMSVTHNYGQPRNPWEMERNPGTSSSGSAVATAAFLCATSLGEDTGGSIRTPAAFCSLVGLRPTWGRVSRYGVAGSCWSMDTVGPMSRTVADCAMTLWAIAGHDPKDPYTWDTSVPHYQKLLNGNIKGIRVGVINERLHTDVVEPDIKSAVSKAITVLGELGADVEEVSLPLSAYSGVINTVISNTDTASHHRRGIMEYLGEYGYDGQVRLLMGSLIPAQAYAKAQKLRALFRCEVLAALEKVDVLVQPTSPNSAPKIPIGGVAFNAKEVVKDDYFDHRSFTTPFNLASVPALSVPCGFTSDDLPIGLQIAGRPFEEELVLKVAYAYEQSTSWHQRKPQI